MDELWKDMSLCSTPVSLQSYHLHSPAAHPYRGGAMYLQDYLAGANSVPQPPRTPPPPPPPHTALSLEFTYLGSSNSATSSGDDPGHFGFSLPGGNSNGGRRSGAALQPAAAGGDRRQRRMIKNRESAARSRARKQAYTNELELELAQLRRENKMLKQREQDFINDRQAKAAELAVPDCRSNRSISSRLQQKQQQQQQQRCRSAPPP